jgi:PadR family transcriptional regulator PadR
MAERLAQEILLAFWKVHILHHAEARPVYGHWLLAELRRHGFSVSPGTLYPILARMEGNGWLRPIERPRPVSPKARRDYEITRQGVLALSRLRKQVSELYTEVVLEAPGSGS